MYWKWKSELNMNLNCGVCKTDIRFLTIWLDSPWNVIHDYKMSLAFEWRKYQEKSTNFWDKLKNIGDSVQKIPVSVTVNHDLKQHGPGHQKVLLWGPEFGTWKQITEIRDFLITWKQKETNNEDEISRCVCNIFLRFFFRVILFLYHPSNPIFKFQITDGFSDRLQKCPNLISTKSVIRTKKTWLWYISIKLMKSSVWFFNTLFLVYMSW